MVHILLALQWGGLVPRLLGSTHSEFIKLSKNVDLVSGAITAGF